MNQLLLRGQNTASLRHALLSCVIGAFGLWFLLPAHGAEPGIGEKWIAPVAKAQKTNPIATGSASIEAGRKIFMQRCAKCHGEAGKGDGPDGIDLNLHPAKFTGSALRDESDGALFWKISVGRKGMPDFGKRLSPTDRWNVINFLRTLGGS